MEWSVCLDPNNPSSNPNLIFSLGKEKKPISGSSSFKAELETRLEQCDSTVAQHIDKIITYLANRLIPQMKKHIFHLAWSPAAQPVEESLKPLTDMVKFENNIYVNISFQWQCLKKSKISFLYHFSWTWNCLPYTRIFSTKTSNGSCQLKSESSYDY